MDYDELAKICDNGTTYVNASHIFHGDKDVCEEYFGESDESCKDKPPKEEPPI